MKRFGIIFALVAGIGGYFGWKYYVAFFEANVTEQQAYLYIGEQDTYEDVLQQVKAKNIVKHVDFFDLVARYMGYTTKVKSGRYQLKPGMSNYQLISKIKWGNQDAVKFRFESIRLQEDFAALLGEKFEADSTAFIQLLDNEILANRYGFTKENFFTIFIPNTYEIYWNTSPEKIIARFNDEYKKFWTTSRREKAKDLGMTTQEVSILAAIVKGEALHRDEMSKIAGLYINRLRQGVFLQADPTVIFANKDFSIRRVLHKHLAIESPYNTYRNAGLPPGPISLPTIASIDAVLNYEAHDYIFMVAREDFSGYHHFAKTLPEHLAYARKYQQALNERQIRK